ncbi:MAG TPA: hypothetical protein VK956_02625, partial [Verrucomicrobium sp.]|nr:hypothetical protein [Verrucomicrobium sp.]
SVPEVYSFNLTETIGLTQWGEPDLETDPDRFRRFRIFTNAVGAAMCSGDKGPDDNLPPNYLAISLLDDAWALQDESLQKLLPAVFSEMHDRVVTARWCADDAPFLILGQLLLALQGHYPVDPSSLVQPLVEAERHCARRKGKSIFLWGCTVFNQMHDQWKIHVDRAFAACPHPLEASLKRLHEGLVGVEDPRTLSLA